MLLYGALVAILVGCTVYVLLPIKLKLSYILDDAHLTTEQPEGTFGNMTCPHDGSELAQIVIIHYPDAVDAPWRSAYYCGAEDIFWIYDYRGGIGKASWYGPFKAYLRWTNSLTICGAAISGIALVITAFRKTRDKQLESKSSTIVHSFSAHLESSYVNFVP